MKMILASGFVQNKNCSTTFPTLNTAEYPIEIPTDTLYWAIEPSLTDVWPNDLLYHFERIEKCRLPLPYCNL